MAPTEKRWWPSGSGRIELQIDIDDAHMGSHIGKCDVDINALRRKPYLKAQLDALDADDVAAELKGYGAWDADELSDHDANLSRLLWIACGDIVQLEAGEI